MIGQALARAGVSADDLELVEAHGTGTALGDPIEVAGLEEAFSGGAQPEPGASSPEPGARFPEPGALEPTVRTVGPEPGARSQEPGASAPGSRPAGGTARRGYCALGSVKTNVGHLEAAAGLAGLIKVLLALGHRQLPPTLHLSQPNGHLRLEETPFYLNDRLRAWPAPEPAAGGWRPRLAAVSAFGIGGTNAHAILAEARGWRSRCRVVPAVRPRCWCCRRGRRRPWPNWPRRTAGI